jgi:hypothetical protein
VVVDLADDLRGEVSHLRILTPTVPTHL